MRRRIYVICQKEGWTKGKPQVISDGAGQLEYVFGSQEGLFKGKQKVEEMNKDGQLNPVHLRKATLIIEEEIKQDVSHAKTEVEKNEN